MVKQSDSANLEQLRKVAQRVIPAGGKVWLYGSRARGDARKDSDWDLLILLPQASITSEDEDRYAYPFVLEGWEHNLDVSPQIYTVDEWNQHSFTPYYKNVEADKINIYGA